MAFLESGADGAMLVNQQFGGKYWELAKVDEFLRWFRDPRIPSERIIEVANGCIADLQGADEMFRNPGVARE
jgi:hypothetical protein